MPKFKKNLQLRNLHNVDYDFAQLTLTYSPLKPFVHKNTLGIMTIDYSLSEAVLALNTALLKHFYGIQHFKLPQYALCPAVPGRVDYIHHIADLLGFNALNNSITSNTTPQLIDIGTGASGIYTLLASSIYDWNCLGSDINPAALDNVNEILKSNMHLNNKISLRLQTNKHAMFTGIIQPHEYYDVAVCNPPFHASLEAAVTANRRKNLNLRKHINKNLRSSKTLNFSGQANELWCNGGEQLFIKKMVKESQAFANQCGWFTSLVSQQETLQPTQKILRKVGATDIKIIAMQHGKKITRILAWTFQ